MKHPHRYDLPKGHIEPSETELECALRELFEETSIEREQVCIDNNFRFEFVYSPKYKRFDNKKVEKTLIMFLGRVEKTLEVISSEHSSYEWIEWNPPHNFQNQIINSLLLSVEQFLKTETKSYTNSQNSLNT